MNFAWSSLCAALWIANPAESYLGLETASQQFFQEEDVLKDEGEGLRVTATTENSPARQAGFQPGDVLLSINGEKPRTPLHFNKHVAAFAVGSRIEVEVLRGEEIFTLTAVTVARLVPREAPPPRAYVERERLGVIVEDLSAEDAANAGLPLGEGARLKRYLKGSALLESELKVGDVLLQADGETIHGGEDFLVLARRFQPGVNVRFVVRREGEQVECNVGTRDPASHVSKFFFPLIIDYLSDTQQQETYFGLLPFNMLKYERRENERSYCLFWLICLETGSNELLEDWQE